MNKKGMTLVEIIVSIVLVSIILIFITRLLITVNGLYKKSKLEVDFEVLDTILIDTISTDINRYGVKSVSLDGKKSVTITFNAFRESNLNELIVKKLSLTDDARYIKYEYVNNNLTSDERTRNFVRKVPDGAIIDENDFVNYKEFENTILRELRVKMLASNGNDFTSNIYFKIAEQR